MIHVIAIITTKPGQRDTVLTAFREIVTEVQAEAGCLEYAPAIDIDNEAANFARLGPDSFIVIEKWESQDALAAHAASAHMAAYAAKVKDLLAARAIHVLDPT